MNIHSVWTRILKCEGQEFRLIGGRRFKYVAARNYVKLSTTNQNIARSQVEKALAVIPLPNTVPIQHLRAPSYIFALLTDPRIIGTLH